LWWAWLEEHASAVPGPWFLVPGVCMNISPDNKLNDDDDDDDDDDEDDDDDDDDDGDDDDDDDDDGDDDDNLQYNDDHLPSF
jgi:hypothetical protein